MQICLNPSLSKGHIVGTVPPVLIYVREVHPWEKIGKQVLIGIIFSMLGLAGRQRSTNRLRKQAFEILFVEFVFRCVLGQRNILENHPTISWTMTGQKVRPAGHEHVM